MAANSSSIQKHMHAFLQSRQYPKTFCPSEVARSLSSSELQDLGMQEWRSAMPLVREVASEMRMQGMLEILQKGSVIDEDIQIEDIRGPIRIRAVRDAEGDEAEE